MQLQLHVDYVNYLIQQNVIEEKEEEDFVQQQVVDYMKYEEDYVIYHTTICGCKRI